MTRPLEVVAGDDPARVFAALTAALSGDGPAILPAEAAGMDVPALVPRRVAVVIQTSGSTGSPKRVALSADALLASAAASESALGGPGEWLLALPAHYVAGVNVLVRAHASGTVPAILPPGHFDPLAFAELSDRLTAQRRFSSVVPAQLSRLLEAAEADLGVLERLRRFDAILVGGQATPATLLERSIELGLTVIRTYGSSETSGGCVYDGRPLAGVEARVVDGELRLSGPMLAEGYLGDEARTAEAFVHDDGRRWYRTGDTGTVDADGLVQVVGRLDDVIISGGLKVSLGEVERVVRELDGLDDAVVVRAPHERWGEVPVVVATRAVDLARLRDAVSAVLGRAAAPAAVVELGAIPLLTSGKPDRVALAEFTADRVQLPR